jgi:hypothetical protein
MKTMAVCFAALSLATLCSLPADAQEQQTPYRPDVAQESACAPFVALSSPARTEPGIVLAQGEVRIPSDAQLERMEERAITTPPLDGSGVPPRARGGQEAEIRQMDERAHRIDEQLMKGGAICTDCK